MLAILIIGKLRFSDTNHLNDFMNIINGFDIFISTYERYKKVGLKLKPKYLNIVDDNIKVKADNIYQWYHLDQIINNKKTDLIKYKYIIKIRTDINITKIPLDIFKSIEDNTMYYSTDLLFYSKSIYFIKVFENFYNLINNYYWGQDDVYLPINYDNILISNLYSSRFDCLNLPKIIHVNIFKDNNNKELFYNHVTKLKNNIIKNRELLNNTKKFNKNEIITFQHWKSNFASEKIFILHILNHGKILTSNIPAQTDPCFIFWERKKWKILE